MVMTGPVGSGKTTLLNTFLYLVSTRRTEYTKVNSAMIVNPLLTRDELMESILDEFDISCSSTSKPRRLNALREFLLQTRTNNGLAVLIIDEAHLMTFELLEEIRLLSNLDTMGGKLLQIVICGQPELYGKLSQPQLLALRQRIAVTAELRALSEMETKKYLEDRLKTAGLNSASPFTAEAVQEIHQTSGGIPRIINLMADQLLLLACSAGKRLIGPDAVRTVKQMNIFGEIETPPKAKTAAASDTGSLEEQVQTSLEAEVNGTR